MARPKDEQKTNAIYQAALTVVMQEGFTGMRMAQVASRAGIATGTLYIYFKDKTELINALFLHLKGGKTQELLKHYRTQDPFPVVFKKLWHAYFKLSLNEPERTLFIEQFQRSSILTPSSKAASDELLIPLHQLLNRGIEEHFVLPLPTEVLMAQITGPIFELVKLKADKNWTPDPNVVKAMFDMAWIGIRR